MGLTENREFGVIVFYNNLKLHTFMKSTLNTSYAHFIRVSCRIRGIWVFRFVYINR